MTTLYILVKETDYQDSIDHRNVGVWFSKDAAEKKYAELQAIATEENKTAFAEVSYEVIVVSTMDEMVIEKEIVLAEETTIEDFHSKVKALGVRSVNARAGGNYWLYHLDDGGFYVCKHARGLYCFTHRLSGMIEAIKWLSNKKESEG